MQIGNQFNSILLLKFIFGAIYIEHNQNFNLFKYVIQTV